MKPKENQTKPRNNVGESKENSKLGNDNNSNKMGFKNDKSKNSSVLLNNNGSFGKQKESTEELLPALNSKNYS